MAAYRSQLEPELLPVVGGMTWIDPTLQILLPCAMRITQPQPAHAQQRLRRLDLSRCNLLTWPPRRHVESQELGLETARPVTFFSAGQRRDCGTVRG